jgi:hypothetical protein
MRPSIPGACDITASASGEDGSSDEGNYEYMYYRPRYEYD